MKINGLTSLQTLQTYKPTSPEIRPKTNHTIDLNLQRQKEQTLTMYRQELKIKALKDKLESIE